MPQNILVRSFDFKIIVRVKVLCGFQSLEVSQNDNNFKAYNPLNKKKYVWIIKNIFFYG